MKHSIIALIVAAAILMSCGASKDRAAMATWPGRTETELRETWGVPTQVVPNGEGKIIVYDKQTYNIYNKPLKMKSFQFFINKDGKVEKYLIVTK